MSELHTGELTLPVPPQILPVNRRFRVSAERFARAKRARAKLAGLLATFAALTALAFIVTSVSGNLGFLHWMSVVLGVLTCGAALITWGIWMNAKWWLGHDNTVLAVTNDEIVIRGTIRIPTHSLVGVWGHQRASKRPAWSISHLLSQHGASTSVVTLLVDTIAPITDSHHRVRRFTKDEEVAGRIEIPIGAYLDDEGTLAEVVASFAAVMGPEKPAMIVRDSGEYASVWSGFPSRISA